MGPLAGDVKILMELPQSGAAMTSEAEMSHQTTSNSVSVEGANVHLGDVLPQHAREGIRRVAAKYFGHLTAASVHFRREGNDYCCTVTMRMGGLPMRSGEAQDKDIYGAFHAALAKVAKQLRRAKRALREDQPVRTDKDMVLRAGLGRPPFT
jgi:ribosomal subunit interface protein